MGIVDADAVLADFEAFLVQDGRSSHGTDFLTRKLAELRAQHRIDESVEAAALRHFSAHLADVFFGLMPSPATSGPLADRDPPGTHTAMADGADIPSTLREVTCQTPAPRSSPPTRDSRPASSQRSPLAAASS